MTRRRLHGLFSGFVLVFCVSFVCLLPVTAALLAKLGVPWVAAPRQVSLFLTIFLVLSAASFLWSYRSHRKPVPCLAGLVSLAVVYIGHELVPNLVIFYVGIVALVAASVLNWKARSSRDRNEHRATTSSPDPEHEGARR